MLARAHVESFCFCSDVYSGNCIGLDLKLEGYLNGEREKVGNLKRADGGHWTVDI